MDSIQNCIHNLKLLFGDGIPDDTEKIKSLLEKFQTNVENLSIVDVWRTFFDKTIEIVNSILQVLHATEPVIQESKDNPSQKVLVGSLILDDIKLIRNAFGVLGVWFQIPHLSVPIQTGLAYETLKKIPQEVINTLILSDSSFTIAGLKILDSSFSNFEIHSVAESFLPEFLGGLLHIGFCQQNTSPTFFSKITQEDRTWARSLFKTTILNPNIHPSNICRSLMMLISSFVPVKHELIPRVSSGLTMFVCESEMGVYAVLATLLDTKQSVDQDAILAASQSIYSIPSFLTPEQYISKISPQIVDLLRNPRSAAFDKFLSSVCEILRRWILLYPTLVLKYIFIPIVSPIAPFMSMYFYNQEFNLFKSIMKNRDNIESSSEININSESLGNGILEIGKESSSTEKPEKMKRKVLIQEIDDHVAIPSEKQIISSSNNNNNLLQSKAMQLDQKSANTPSSEAKSEHESLPNLYINSIEILKTGANEAFSRLVTSAKKQIELENDNAKTDQVIVSSQVIHTMILALVALCTSSSIEFINVFSPIMPFLIDFLPNKNLPLNKEIRFIVERFFNLADVSVSLDLLKYYAIYNDRLWAKLSEHLKFTPSLRFYYLSQSESGAKDSLSHLPTVSQNSIENFNIFVSIQDKEDLRDLKSDIDNLVNLLEFMNEISSNIESSNSQSDKNSMQRQSVLESLPGDLFLYILEQLFVSMNISKSFQFQSDTQDESSVNALIELSEKQMLLLNILIPLLDNLGPAVLRNSVQICMFLKTLLQTDDDSLHSVALPILSQIISHNILSYEESSVLLVDMIGDLRNIVDSNDTQPENKSLSQSLIDTILNLKNKKIQDDDDEESKEDNSADKSTKIKRKWVGESKVATVEEALKLISSPIIPIRAGGLIHLRRLLLREDSTALEKLPEIIKVFSKNLSNSDSYVYLGAIQGLSAVADINFEFAWPHLEAQYKGKDTLSRTLEIRLNVGEAILQSARRLGQMLPHYAHHYIATFMYSIRKDPQPLIRASSLSNLAECCELLRYGLLQYIVDIMDMIYEVILVETKDEMIRRAAVMLLGKLFKGLDKDILHIISDQLDRIRPLLEMLRDSSNDIILQEHARIALIYYENSIFESVKSAVNSAHSSNLLDPQGFYDSLKIIK